MTVTEPGVCVALDVPTLEEARKIVEELHAIIPLFKVGLELFCAEGPRTVEAVRGAGAEVFLDLKVNDIPRTAAAAVREAGKLGVRMLTIHGAGGREMVRASVEASSEQGGPDLLVVSALTSFDDATLAEVGVSGGVREHAMRIGRIAAEEGAGGLVLSPHELDVVRSALPHLLLCTPGVRPAGTGVDDHRRALTPAEAVVAGADLIVLGRPILNAPDRVEAARRLVEEVLEAEARREGRRGHEVVSASIAEAEDAEVEVEEGP